MNREFIIVEAGSTLTKAYLYKEEELSELPFEFIEFKKHYSNLKTLVQEDLEKLFNYINGLKKITPNIYIYGTSIFRILSDEERNDFLNLFILKTNLKFNIVSSDLEEEYTVKGMLSNIEYDGNIAIVVSGGGSTEIAICNKGNIIETSNLDMGGVDIVNMYPDLAFDKATSNIDEVVNYIKDKLNNLKNKADIVVTGGGATKYFREKAHYNFIEEVPFKYNKNEFVIIDDLYNQDRNYFYHISLEEMKRNMPDTPNWWNPTRAINAFVLAVFMQVDAKYLAASNINMIYGIAEEILSK